MSEEKRLTMERIEEIRPADSWMSFWRTPVITIELRQLCDLALSALSQEAVRDEAQDRIDADRYRHWRNAKIGEASHDYHFDDLLGKIENACDLANEIDAAIDADMQRLGK